MKIVFITGLYPKGTEDILLSECRGSGLQVASNTFQWALVDGLMENNIDLQVLSFPFLPCYPMKYKSVSTPTANIEYNGNEIGEMISYSTLPVLKNYSIQGLLQNKLEELLRKIEKDEHVVVLTYTVSPKFIKPLVKLKKKYKITICPIITDLIENYNDPIYKRSLPQRLQGIWECRQTIKNYPYIDKYILLSEAMKEVIPYAKDRSIIVEGIASVKKDYYVNRNDGDKKMLLYTGALAAHSSVNDLVDAFCLTNNPDFRLVICGNGVWRDYILERAKADNRIIFRGQVSRQEALELQKEATALINPRKPNLSVTRFSFPSKTMEYLSSGTPMIGYKLEGIPSEYYPYYYTVEDLTSDGLAGVITNVLTKPSEELEAKAKKAFDFIASNKTAEIQAAKIIDFISK